MSQAVFTAEAPSPVAALSAARRTCYASLGVVCVGIAAVGVIVPGLPTAIWLIAATYLFARSNPRLEAKLVRNRFFGPYLRYVDNPRSMPRHAKIVAVAMMWGSVLISSGVFVAHGAAGWIPASLIAAAALGTWVIVRLRPAE